MYSKSDVLEYVNEEDVKFVRLAFFTAFARSVLQSFLYGVPSGYEIVQNMRTTLPVFGLHGRIETVVGSGCKNKSDFSGVSKP